MARLILAAIAALAAPGCGDTPATLPDAAPDAPPDAPPPPSPVPDLRFQWVGAYPRYAQTLFTNITPSLSQSLHGELAWAPLQLKTTQGGSAGWELANFTPVAAIETIDSIARAGELLGMADDVQALLTHNYVITSLDITPGGYGLIATAPVSGFPLYSSHTIVIDRARLTAWTADEGRSGRIVTAISPTASGTALQVISFGRNDDTTVYETQVADTTFATLAASAMALAADGYIITAFGRNGDGPLLLIGTRPAGVTTPRTITVQTDLPQLADHGALVAWVLDSSPATPPFQQLAILER